MTTNLDGRQFDKLDHDEHFSYADLLLVSDTICHSDE